MYEVSCTLQGGRGEIWLILKSRETSVTVTSVRYKNARLVSCGVERTLNTNHSSLAIEQMCDVQTKKLLSWFTATALNFLFKIFENFGEYFVANDDNILKKSSTF
jgi:hypothetical protein